MRRGDRFINNTTGDKYILASVGINEDTGQIIMSLVNITEGTRWSKSIEVKNEFRLTDDEIIQLFGETGCTLNIWVSSYS